MVAACRGAQRGLRTSADTAERRRTELARVRPGGGCSQRTIDKYTTLCRTHVIPALVPGSYATTLAEQRYRVLPRHSGANCWPATSGARSAGSPV